MVGVGVLGASGYTGGELLRLCSTHPDLNVAWAAGDATAGTAVAEQHPNLAAAYPDMIVRTFEPSMAADVGLLFLALPHGASQKLVIGLLDSKAKVVDLSADFRLHDAAAYERWYKQPHSAPELIDRFVYGLPEFHRDEIAKADAVAAPGCYPTATALALAPLVAAGVIEPSGIIVDAASGVSGAGRGLTTTTHFGSANEDFRAYGLLHHRHTPEMEQAVGAQLLFTPHLAPMTRGILATCYARPTGTTSTEALLELLSASYAGEPFVVVDRAAPSTKATWGSNTAQLSARFDERTGWVVVLAAIDNLVKGASGQALQCANLMLGLDETAGLPRAGIAP
ncbi:MAG TPA: N-acetyl-gamma-glutamyl-phosphate reductase [Acidimicrobiales bacterium]|nr:N-acetyl-gamma-glutamyl-phosphate reductase [Acidimicrobiales bacterium]